MCRYATTNPFRAMNRRLLFTFSLLTSLTFLLTNCVYNTEAELYPELPEEETPVDTCGLPDVVSYSSDIEELLVKHQCVACHETADPAGGITLEGYTNVVPYIEDGSLLGSIEYDPQWSRMPKGYDRVPDCEVAMIAKWIEQGYPDN